MNGDESRALSCVCVYLVVPCSLLNAFQTAYDPAKLEGLAIAFVLSVLVHVVFLGVSKGLSRGKHPLSAGERACVIYNNAGNLIIPLVQSTLGSEYVIYTCSYLVVQNLLLWTHGQALMGGDHRPSIKKLLFNPNLCAIFLGLILFFLQVRLPSFLGSAVSSLGSCVGPLAMLVVGVLLAEADLKSALRSIKIYRTVLLRLVIFPLLTVALLWATTLIWKVESTVAVLTVVLLCAIGPSASTVTQLAQIYRSPERQFISSVNVVTTLLCAITMPLFCLLFQLLAG